MRAELQEHTIQRVHALANVIWVPKLAPKRICDTP